MSIRNFRDLANRGARRATLARLRRRLRRGDKGAMAVLCAVMIPVLIGFGTLAIDQGYVTYRSMMLRQTVQSAALAAAGQLGNYYSTGTTTAMVNAAQSFAALNMPTAQYGTVVPSANVVVGTWNTSTNSFSAGGSTPNAVQVTGVSSSANGNPVPLFFSSLWGKSSVDMSSTAVASNAAGATGSGSAVAAGTPFNTIIINDMSQSFSGEITNQKNADLAILNCLNGQTNSQSQFGITFINGAAYTYQPLEVASGLNFTLLQAKINLITACTALEDPNCSTGSNVASGLYSAIQQLSGSAYNGQSKNIVIITDGAPDVKRGYNYTTADGVSCGTGCAQSDLESAAQSLAATAKAAGISISTIYYSGDDTNPTDQANYKAFLASLVTGWGVALVAPTAAQIDSSYNAVCSTIPASVKTSS